MSPGGPSPHPTQPQPAHLTVPSAGYPSWPTHPEHHQDLCHCSCLYHHTRFYPGTRGLMVGINSLASLFSTMTLTPLAATYWVADSGAFYHITLNASILSSFHPTLPSHPSIIVGNRNMLLITSIGDSVLPWSFHLHNVLTPPPLISFKIFYLFISSPLITLALLV